MLDDIVEIVFEIAGEIFVDAFAHIIASFIPEDKMTDKAYKTLCIVLYIVAVVLLFMLFIGVLIVIENLKNILGWIFISVPIILVAVSLILKLTHKKGL